MAIVVSDKRKVKEYTSEVLAYTMPGATGIINVVDLSGMSYGDKSAYHSEMIKARAADEIPDTLTFWHPLRDRPLVTVPATDRGDLIALIARGLGYDVVVTPVVRARDHKRHCYIFYNDMLVRFSTKLFNSKTGAKFIGSAIISKALRELGVQNLVIPPRSNNHYVGTRKVAGSGKMFKDEVATALMAITMDFDFEMAEKVFEPEDNIRTRVISLREVLGRVVTIEELKSSIIDSVINTFPNCEVRR